MRFFVALSITHAALAASPPAGFPSSGKGLWYERPGTIWSRDYLPVGNGYLGAMVPGGTSLETTQLNIESMWSGGPFEQQGYNGGNKQPPEKLEAAEYLRNVRQTIFRNPSGIIENITGMATDAGAYGSYAGAGYLISTLNVTGEVSEYGRFLDLDQAVARTTWTQGGKTYSRETFCSNPTQACVQHIQTRKPSTLPAITYTWSTFVEEGLPQPDVTCLDSSTLRVRGNVTKPGMIWEILGRVQSVGGKVVCAKGLPGGGNTNANATITVNNASEAWISWVGGTEFDQSAGDAAHGFSFHGADPHKALSELIARATTSKGYASTLGEHVTDFSGAISRFSLSLGPLKSSEYARPTNALLDAYQTDAGNTYLELLLFNYGRYLLTTSTRSALPANLQGKWAHGYSNAWSADYHANINTQMNYWAAEMTNLGPSTKSLFDYMEKNWAPRGAQTADVLYNISRGWVVHNEMNVFGHSGFKAAGNSAEWANYPEAAVWMMFHVYDRFDHSNDITWWKQQGWPLIKRVAQFQLDRLQLDEKFKDGTLITNPCNSPEQAHITFGCAHTQQMLWQLFNYVEKGFDASGDKDVAFLAEVKAKRAVLDKGIRIGSWGQLQEWKMDVDKKNDLHRHLSHLIGLYPGYAITEFDPTTQGKVILPDGSEKTYTKKEVVDAASIALLSRGEGTGPDADAGWAKVWRAAAWAQLGDAKRFYHILSYAIATNFGGNLFSLYNPAEREPIFQIDANLGYPAAVMSALIQAPDTPTNDTPLTITLLPALPESWSAQGEIKGARIRGGITLSLRWGSGKLQNVVMQVDHNIRTRIVQVVYKGKIVKRFATSAGLRKTLSF